MTLTKLIWKIERFIIRPRCEKCVSYSKVKELERTSQQYHCPLMGYVQSWSNCMYYEKRKK